MSPSSNPRPHRESGEPLRLRRPADIAAEMASGRPPGRVGGEADLEWPEGFASAASDRTALLVLLSLAALTPRRLLELAAEHGVASACLEEVLAGHAGSEADRAYASSIDPADVADGMRAAGARLVAVHDPEYPPALHDLADPPAGLFVVGSPLSEVERAVAIVGARRCSALGADVAKSLAAGLARTGVCVASGGARGIDGAAHRGALDAGGTTVAVLGCGVDMPYPAEHRGLFADIRRQGALVGEYPPGTRAEPFRFPARNRIVAALSCAVVVVEGARGSGSMITAEHAMEIGRDVFAVPGSVTSPLSFAPHMLIRDGAGLVRGPDDLLGDLGIAVAGSEAGGTAATNELSSVDAALGADERAVWDALVGPSAPDQLVRDVNRPLSRVMGALVGLELRRMVRQVGGRYERRPSP